MTAHNLQTPSVPRRFSLRTLLIGVPLVAIAVSIFAQFVLYHRNLDSTTHLIQVRLAADLADGQVWHELQRRMIADQVSKRDTERVFALIIDRLERGNDKDREYVLILEAQSFTRLAESKNLVSNATLMKLVDAWHPGPSADHIRARPGTVSVSLSTINHRYWHSYLGSPLELAWDVERVTFKGSEIERRDVSDRHPGRIQNEMAVGNYEVKVDLVCGYMTSTTSATANIGGYLPRDKWKPPTKEWRTTVAIPITVYPEDKEIVKLVRDSSRDPTRFARKLEIRKTQANPKKIYVRHDLTDHVKDLPIGICFDRFVVVKGKRIPHGYFYCFYDAKKGGAQLGNIGWTFDAAGVEAFDLELVPNPRHVEMYTNLKEIWGQTVVVQGVKVPK